MDWLWNGAVHLLTGVVPTWAWVVVAGVAIGWAWRTFGWQGVVGGLVAVLTLGAYRQGWRDRDGRDADVVGKRNAAGDVVVGRYTGPDPAPRRKVKTVADFLKEWRTK